jgi:hypothetical protein
MKIGKLQIAITAAALAVASSECVAQLNVTIDTPNPSEDVYISINPVGSSQVPTQDGVDVIAGIYVETVNGVVTPGFCIDVAHDVYIGEVFNNYSYSSLANAAAPPAGPMTGTEAVDIEKLWAAYYTQAQGSALDAAALQVAIWETLGNGQPLGNGAPGYTVTDGNHSDSTTTAVFNQAQTYINSLSGLQAEADLGAIVSPTGQAYVVAVPEPTTMISGALLLLPFGASTLRIVRKNRKP